MSKSKDTVDMMQVMIVVSAIIAGLLILFGGLYLIQVVVNYLLDVLK